MGSRTCPGCSSPVDLVDGAKAVQCTDCGRFVEASPTPVERPGVEASETEPAGRCPGCGSATASTFACAVCASCFCDGCPGRHLPPGVAEAKAAVRYKHRIRGATDWKDSTVRFARRLHTPLCPRCYDREFAKATADLDAQIKAWYADLAAGLDSRIVAKTMPEPVADVPVRRLL